MFQPYNFIEKKQEKIAFINRTQNTTFYFVHTITETELICDEFDRKIVKNSVKIPLEQAENYQIKNVKSTFKIREYYPETAHFIDNPKVFNSITEIEEAVAKNEIKIFLYLIREVSVFCDMDCRTLTIDPAAPWPPKAA